MHEELLADPTDASAWTRFAERPEPQREAIIDALKSELDQLVRRSPPEALALADLLFRAGEATPSRMAVGLRGRAVARHVNDLADEALADYLAAIELYRADGVELEVARLERALIDLHHLAGRNELAFACAGRARATFEELGEARQLAQLEVNLGNVYFRQDELAAAGASYGAAADRFRAMGDDTGTAIAEFNRGNVEVYAGRYAEADGAYAAAAAIFEKSEHWVHVAECEYAQAWMLSMRCRFAEAIGALEAARARFAEHGRPSRTPLPDLDLAELYLRLDARWDAISHASSAIDAFAKLDMDYELAKALTVRGLAHGRRGGKAESATALADLNRAQDVFKKLGNEHQALALGMQRAAASIAIGLPTEPLLQDLSRAQAVLTEGSNALLAGASTIVLARAKTACGDAADAISLLEPLTTTTAERSALDILLHADAVRALAEAQLHTGDRKAARASLTRAVDCIDETRAAVPGSDARMAFFRDRHGAFVTLARLLGEDGDAFAALVMLERGRSQEARQKSAPNDAANAERERLDSLLLRRLDADLGALTGNTEASSAGPSDTELLDAERSLTQLLRERGAAMEAPRFNAERLQAALKPGEAALSYLADELGLGLILSTNFEHKFIALAADPSEITGLAERLELALRKRLSGRSTPAREARAQAKIEEILAKLGALLIEPALPLAEEVKRLIFIPYGNLHGLPFHAFRTGETFLAERFEVSLASGLLPLARSRSERKCGARQHALVAARDEALPAIAEEARALQAIYGAPLVEVAPSELGGKLLSGEITGGLLHIAAHGAFQPHNPLFSGLSFGSTVLTAHDVRSMSLNLEVVTLGSCEAGRSGRIEGEALIGIDQAFLSAGARAVVSSLWVVDDQVAADLMVALHKELEAGSTVGAALATAQRKALLTSKHPFHWAPFVLSGDPDASFQT